MSLQVWLPLNGSLENNGLYTGNISLLGSTSYIASGKIGSALNLTTDSHGASLVNYMPVCSTYTSYTLCAWVYMTGTATNHSSSILSSGNWNAGTSQCCFGLYSYSNGYNTLLVPNKSSWNVGISLSKPCVLNTWYHVCCTYDGSVTKAYINGEYVGQYNGGGITSTSESNNLYIGAATYYSGFTLRGKINDLRIYDECLSLAEIKDISKALVCHIPLNNGYVEPTTNLVTGLQSGGQTTIENNNTVVTSGTNADTYFNILMSESLTQGTVYTISCYAENIPEGTGWTFPIGGQSNTSLLFNINNNGRNSYTFTMNDFNAGSNHCFMDDTRRTAYAARCRFSNWQIEKKSHVTPYTPTSRAENTLYDVSGYKNNFTINSTIAPEVVANSSPRYDKCSYFTSSKYADLSSLNCSGYSTSYTFSWWANVASWGGKMCWGFGSPCMINFYDGHYWNIGDGGENPFYKPNTTTVIDAPPTNSWHHFAITGNGTQVKLYMDGELYGVAKTNRNLSTAALRLNCWAYDHSYPITGYLSDFRIYATTLDEASIKELYNMPIKITRNGSLITNGEVIE